MSSVNPTNAMPNPLVAGGPVIGQAVSELYGKAREIANKAAQDAKAGKIKPGPTFGQKAKEGCINLKDSVVKKVKSISFEDVRNLRLSQLGEGAYRTVMSVAILFPVLLGLSLFTLAKCAFNAVTLDTFDLNCKGTARYTADTAAKFFSNFTGVGCGIAGFLNPEWGTAAYRKMDLKQASQAERDEAVKALEAFEKAEEAVKEAEEERENIKDDIEAIKKDSREATADVAKTIRLQVRARKAFDAKPTVTVPSLQEETVPGFMGFGTKTIMVTVSAQIPNRRALGRVRRANDANNEAVKKLDGRMEELRKAQKAELALDKKIVELQATADKLKAEANAKMKRIQDPELVLIK